MGQLELCPRRRNNRLSRLEPRQSLDGGQSIMSAYPTLLPVFVEMTFSICTQKERSRRQTCDSSHMYNASSMLNLPSMMSLAVNPLRVSVMIVLQKHVFVSAVRRKCHRCNAQAGEASLKSIPSRERPCVSPRLSALFASASSSPDFKSIFRRAKLTFLPMDRLRVCQLQLRKLWGRSP